MSRSESFWELRDPVLREMWAAGDRSADIARVLGVQPNAINERRRALGLPARKPGNRAQRRPVDEQPPPPVPPDKWNGLGLEVQLVDQTDTADARMARAMAAAGRRFSDDDVRTITRGRPIYAGTAVLVGHETVSRPGSLEPEE